MKAIKVFKVFFMFFFLYVLCSSCQNKRDDKTPHNSMEVISSTKISEFEMKGTKPLIDVYCENSKIDESIDGSLEVKGIERIDTRIFNLDVTNGIFLKTTTTYMASNLTGNCISIKTVASSIEGEVKLQGWTPDYAIDDPYVFYDHSTDRVSIQIDGDFKSGTGAFSAKDPTKIEHYSIVLCYNLSTGAYKSGGIIKLI